MPEGPADFFFFGFCFDYLFIFSVFFLFFAFPLDSGSVPYYMQYLSTFQNCPVLAQIIHTKLWEPFPEWWCHNKQIHFKISLKFRQICMEAVLTLMVAEIRSLTSLWWESVIENEDEEVHWRNRVHYWYSTKLLSICFRVSSFS